MPRLGMDAGPQVVNVDRMDGDAVITFEDGLVARFSAALLRGMLHEAEIFPEADPEPDEEADAQAGT